MTKRSILYAAAAVIVTACGSASTASIPAGAPGANGLQPTTSHGKPPVVLILMENKEYSTVIGSSKAPYLNNMLVPSGTLFTNYFAVSHPSLPNYLAITTGTTCGKDGTDAVQPLCKHHSIWAQLHASHVPASQWSEGETADCTWKNFALYAVRHDAYGIVTDARALPCGDHTLGSGMAPGVGALVNALKGSSPPKFAFVTPNLCDDMHDCLVPVGDAWLRANVPLLRKAGAIVIVTWDEGKTNLHGGGHVATVEVGPGVRAGAKNGTFYTHYSLLAGLEKRFGLPLLGKASGASALPIG